MDSTQVEGWIAGLRGRWPASVELVEHELCSAEEAQGFPPPKLWGGRARIACSFSESVRLGSVIRVELDDGRQGKAHVLASSYSKADGPTLFFAGLGPLAQEAASQSA